MLTLTVPFVVDSTDDENEKEKLEDICSRLEDIERDFRREVYSRDSIIKKYRKQTALNLAAIRDAEAEYYRGEVQKEKNRTELIKFHVLRSLDALKNTDVNTIVTNRLSYMKNYDFNEEDYEFLDGVSVQISEAIKRKVSGEQLFQNADIVLSPEKVEKNKALYQLSITVKEWATNKSEKGDIYVNLSKSNRTYTRFRTAFMDTIIPDAPGTKSGWNTTNHYFYEVINSTGKSLFAQLAISSKEMPADQIEMSNRINTYFPTKETDKEDWAFRVPFQTETISFVDVYDKQAVFAQLDNWLQEIRAFEEELKNKLL